MQTELSSYAHLPEAYRSDSGEMVVAPCWRLLAPGYYGETYWLDGEILTMDIPPNHHMEPLNKAAGERLVAYMQSLPLNGSGLKDEDLLEAAFMLRPREGEKELTHDQHAQALIKLALQLKAKREGTGRLKIPELQGVRPVNSAGAPPMANATFTDPRTMSFGQQQGAVIHQPQIPDNKRVRKVTPATGNMPAESGAPRA